MTAEAILARILKAGGRLISDPNNPRLLVPPHFKLLVSRHRDALKALLINLATAADIQSRAAVFRRQMAVWESSSQSCRISG